MVGFTGWVGYTLSRSEIQVSGINNNGSWYPAIQDRPNDISVVGAYIKLLKKWTISATFVYYDR